MILPSNAHGAKSKLILSINMEQGPSIQSIQPGWRDLEQGQPLTLLHARWYKDWTASIASNLLQHSEIP